MSVSCSRLIYDMVGCIPFFSVGSTKTKPSPLCCLGFQVVLDTDAERICEGIKRAVFIWGLRLIWLRRPPCLLLVGSLLLPLANATSPLLLLPLLLLPTPPSDSP